MGDFTVFIETVINGLLAGVMYSLVALGFVLIFKASGIFNFAQGVFALFAGLTLHGLLSKIESAQVLPDWLPLVGGATIYIQPWFALAGTVAIMILLAYLLERLVLRYLVNQEPIILFMATIGLAYFLEGLGDILWGSDVKVLKLCFAHGSDGTATACLPEGASDWLLDNFNIYAEKLEIAAAVTAAVLITGLALFFNKTRIGRALRAVADDHQAALSVGISLRTIWVTVWSVAGIVALFAGVMWGAKSGIQFSLSLIALKALPVLILGGFTSIPGAIVGGLIIGVGEKLAEIYVGDIFNGAFGWDASIFKAIEGWFAYMLALVVLLFRPQGLFGEKIIERI